MSFVELRFLFFFVVVFCVYWAVRSNAVRKLWLLAASYVFYGAWDWRFLSLLVLSTLIDYAAGLGIANARRDALRKRWLWLSIVGQLGLLGFFKYCDFFLESLIDLGAALGLSLHAPTLQIILPVGVSFYTFQSLSYTFDVYLRRLQPTRSLLDFALFVAFFPQLVAGPIVRARDFLHQLPEARRFDSVAVRPCLVLLLVGYFKKACVSDNLAPWVDRYFDDPLAYTALAAWTAVLFYAAQIYCDFSGYSDMAIALAGLLGYELRLNFDFPYLARSITEFWSRWHMSLSSWLKDYLYVPLGGNRGGTLFTYRNLMITMLLGGLWHGASWNFVIWGGLHGLALVAHKQWSRLTGLRPRPTPAGRVVGTVLSFWWVCATWILFRAQDLPSAVTVLRSFVLLESPGAQELPQHALILFGGLALLHWAARRKALGPWWERLPAPAFAAAYGALFAAALSLVPLGYRPFIYFQF